MTIADVPLILLLFAYIGNDMGAACSRLIWETE